MSNLMLSLLVVLVLLSDNGFAFGMGGGIKKNNKEILRLNVEEDKFPFMHGVGSADPLEDSVLIWTRISPPWPFKKQTQEESNYQIEWKVWPISDTIKVKAQQDQLWDNPAAEVAAQGSVTVSPDNDYTLTVDVQGLLPNTKYYYQFQDHPKANATHTRRSRVGSTRTLITNQDEVDVAVLSCTSLWSGYFNMYRHLAHSQQASDLAAIVHLGDFIYPDLDPDELYRVPYGLCKTHFWFSPTEHFHGDPSATQTNRAAPGIRGQPEDNEDPYVAHMMATFPHCSENRTVSTIPGRSGVPDAVALSQFRWMHQLYMMDPDLRDARAKHPFIVQFDNHDLGDDYPSLATHKGSAKAGYEWVPQRVNLIRDDDGELTDVETFRHFPLGQDNLFDLILLDTGAYMGNYSYKETHGLLGQGQRAWLQQVLTNSSSAKSQWRVIASGKAFMPLTLNKLGQAVIKSSAMVFLFPLGILSLLVALQVFLHRRRRRRSSANDKTSFRQRTRSIEMDLLANSRQGEAAAYDVGVGDDETEELVTGGDHKDENDEEEEEEDTDDASSEEESVPLSPTRGGGGTDNPNPPQRRRSGRKPRTNKEMLCEAHEESPLLLRCTATFCRGITIAWPVFFMIVAILVRKLAMKGDGLFLFDNSPVVWTGNHESTIHLFDLLDETNTDSNNLWVTGDEHLCYASDVFRYNPYQRDILHYNPNDDSNTTRYGVEMLPCSGTRGNLDEMAGSILGPLFHPRGMLSFLSKFILHDAVVLINRHFRYFNGDDHGYGLVKVTREQITATFYFFPILEVTNKHNTKTMVVRDGGNKWE